MSEKPDKIIFQRKSESRENAFTLLVPQGWLIEGGVIRADHMRQVVNAQTIEAKIDFAAKRDAAGTAMIRFCPQVKYSDPRYMVMPFPIGSNYNGMLVYPLMSAAQFLAQMLFPWAHPQAQQAQMVGWGNKASPNWCKSSSSGIPW